MNYLDKKPQEGYGYIYRYTSPSGKSYIGQTIQSLRGRSGPFGGKYATSRVFFNAIEKYGFENFEVEILKEVPIEDLNEEEYNAINKYSTLAPNGYNINNLISYTEEFGRCTPVDQYTIKGEYIRSFSSLMEASKDIGCYYQTLSEVVNGKRTHYKGYIYVRKGEECHPVYDHKTQGRKTGQYDLKGNLLNIYESAAEAGRAVAGSTAAGRNIRTVCAGKRNTAYGYHWKYLD